MAIAQAQTTIAQLEKQVLGIDSPRERKKVLPRSKEASALGVESGKGMRHFEREYNNEYQEMRDLFGENFLGMEEVEKSFTLKDGTKLIEITSDEEATIVQALHAKLAEPDIQEFIQKFKNKELDPKEWMLVLRTDAITVEESIGSNVTAKKHRPLTMETMQKHLAPDMTAQSQGKLLYNIDGYAQESFYLRQRPGDTQPFADDEKFKAAQNRPRTFHWQLVTRATVPGTKSKSNSQQSDILQQKALACGLNPTKTHRRTPVETTYDFACALRATGTRILVGEYDRSDTKTSVGSFVRVGLGNASGLAVIRGFAGSADSDVGASLSR